MKKLKKNVERNKGFSLIEILISIAVAAVVLPAVIILLGFSTFTTSQGETYTKAYTIAQKEIENIYSIKASDWSDPYLDEGIKSLPTEGIFNKTLTVTDIDPDRQKIEIRVFWDERGTTQDTPIES